MVNTAETFFEAASNVAFSIRRLCPTPHLQRVMSTQYKALLAWLPKWPSAIDDAGVPNLIHYFYSPENPDGLTCTLPSSHKSAWHWLFRRFTEPGPFLYKAEPKTKTSRAHLQIIGPLFGVHAPTGNTTSSAWSPRPRLSSYMHRW